MKKKCTDYLSVDLLFYKFLLIIRRFLVKPYFINNLLNCKTDEIYNSDRDRFTDRSLYDQRI